MLGGSHIADESNQYYQLGLLESKLMSTAEKLGNAVCPVLPTEVLPNGATVIAVRRKFPHNEWFVLAMWHPEHAEFITWQVDPKTLDCFWGHYNCDLPHAWEDFVERST